MGFPEPREPLDEEPGATPEPSAGDAKPSWFVSSGQGAFLPTEDETQSRPTIPTIGQPPPPPPELQFRGREEIESGGSQYEFGSEGSEPDDDAERAEGDSAEPTDQAPAYRFLDEPGEEEPPRFKPQWATSEPSAPQPAWRIALDRFRADRRIQMIVLLGALAVLSMASLGSRNSGMTSIHTIRRDAAAYDGRSVKVRGRVGEVFPMGASCAFNLHQGRDTIVVFSRQRAPATHQQVVIEGSVSTGYLEGQPRATLFEAPR